MRHQHRLQQWYRAVLACLFAGVFLAGQGRPAEVWADTIYSYVDDKGNPVYTDKLETIPEKYRAKAKMHELSDEDSKGSKGSSVIQSVQQTFKDQVKAIRSKVPSNLPGTGEHNLDQEAILNYAGGAAVFLLLIMYFSKNSPMIRLLALGLLIVLGIGTPVLVYTSTGGALDVMQQKVTATGQAQQNRLQQVP
jgi:hypothetical protein